MICHRLIDMFCYLDVKTCHDKTHCNSMSAFDLKKILYLFHICICSMAHNMKYLCEAFTCKQGALSRVTGLDFQDRDKVVGLLLGQLDRPKEPGQTAAHVQRLWLEGSMTNFDYLTSLSKLAGRSFNDLMQYPVFPFVLRDYDSEELDLENSASFR